MKWGIIAVAILKGGLELGARAVPLMDRSQTTLKRSALLLTGPLRHLLILRFSLLVIAGLIFTATSLPERSRDLSSSQELGCACDQPGWIWQLSLMLPVL